MRCSRANISGRTSWAQCSVQRLWRRASAWPSARSPAASSSTASTPMAGSISARPPSPSVQPRWPSPSRRSGRKRRPCRLGDSRRSHRPQDPDLRRRDMQIYWIKAQAPRRVLALVKHLGLEAESVEKDLMAGEMKRPDYVALNPNMKAPTLVDDDLVLWEASAIMAHLCIKVGSDMWPAHRPSEQVEVLRWLSWNDCHWAGAVSPY